MAIADAMRMGWTRMPDRVSMTYQNQVTPGSYQRSTVTDCWRRSRGLIEAENSAGVYSFQRADIYIPRAKLSTQPKPGDIITIDATTNTVSPYYGLDGDYILVGAGVSEVGALGAWQCTTWIPFLRSGLTETVSIYRPTFAAGAGGRNVEIATTTIASGISVKIQPTPPNVVGEDFGKLQIPDTAQCFLTTTLDVQAHDYLIDSQNQQWSVMAEERTSMLGVLQGIRLERLK